MFIPKNLENRKSNHESRFEFFGIESWRSRTDAINILFSLPRIAGIINF